MEARPQSDLRVLARRGFVYPAKYERRRALLCFCREVRTSPDESLRSSVTVRRNRTLFERDTVKFVHFGQFFLMVSYDLRTPISLRLVYRLAEKVCAALTERWPEHFALPVDDETRTPGVQFGMTPLAHDRNRTRDFCIHVQINSHDSLPTEQEVVEVIRSVEHSHFLPGLLVAA